MKQYFLSILCLTAVNINANPSFYCPDNFQLIPNNGGISFIDNGRLWIKRWHKPCPQSPRLDYLLSPLGPVKWLDENTCYTSAKRQNRFSIYRISVDGSVACLASCSDADCLFPCIVGERLFFIKRTQNTKHYSIVQAPYDDATPEEIVDFFEPPQPCAPEKTHTTLVDLGTKAVTFFYMASAKEGFFIANYTYHRLSKKNNTWRISENLT